MYFFFNIFQIILSMRDEKTIESFSNKYKKKTVKKN